MRRAFVLLCLTMFATCAPQEVVAPPLDRFFYPSGMAHLQVPGKTAGVLLVANSNGNKRYGAGSVVAVDLDLLSDLPALGAAPPGIVEVTNLRLFTSQQALVGSYLGELHVSSIEPGSEWRVYLASRAEFNRVYRLKLTLDGTAPKLDCIGSGADGMNCVETGVSTTPPEFEKSVNGLPRAPQPFAVATQVRRCDVTADCCTGFTRFSPACTRTCEANVCRSSDGTPFSDVWVTHISQADSPQQSGENFRGYLVHLDSDHFTVNYDSFVDLGLGASHSAVTLGDWVYVSGRLANPTPNVLRMVRRDGLDVRHAGVEYMTRVADARAVRVSSDERQLYIVGRVPDTLIVADLLDPGTSYPSVRVTRVVPMVDAASDAKVIPRAGRGDLVVVAGASNAIGTVGIYDADVGEVVAVVRGVGLQPSHLAVDVRGDSARIFVSGFGDGRVAVIDIDDLARPYEARLVAFLGRQQACLVTEDSVGCRAIGEVVE